MPNPSPTRLGALRATQPFAIQTRDVGRQAWEHHDSGITDERGSFEARIYVTSAIEVRAVYDLGFAQDPAIGTVRINPRYAVAGRPHYSWREQSIVVKGSVLPRGKGQPVLLEVARKRGGVWH